VKREITFFQNTKSTALNGNVLRYHKHTGLDAAFGRAKQDKRTSLEHCSSPEFHLKWMLECQMWRSVLNTII
jgi:hypothetical protein